MKKIYIACLLMLATLTTRPQETKPDPAFGNKGIVQTGFGYHGYYTKSECLQVLPRADGSFYLVFEMELLRETHIVRRLANGALDVSYGENGYSAVAMISDPRAVLLPDGKIVVAGSRIVNDSESWNWDFTLVRFQANGSLDTSFGGDGKQATDFWGNQDFSYALALQPDGKLVAAGISGYHFAIARYESNGSLDSSFSKDGRDTCNFGSVQDIAYGVAIKSDGKIIVAGRSTYFGLSRVSVACYLPDGSLDNSFSSDGMDTLALAKDCGARAVAIQPDGKILLAGYRSINVPGYQEFALVRLNENGSYDPTFSGDGIQTTDFGSFFEEAHAIQLQNDGKILIGGASYGIARFNSDGSPDNSFSSDGKVNTSIGAGDILYTMALQADGKILAAGASNFRELMYSAVRYNSDGSLDNTLDGDGKLADYKRSSGTRYNASAVQRDGKLVTVGDTYVTLENTQACVARYNVDGTLDNTFSGDGKLLLDFGPGYRSAQAIAIQQDGKIIIGGSNTDFVLARLNPDGTYDNSFSGDGILFTDFGGDGDFLASICIQPNGKIIAGGGNFAVARYNPDGTPDNTFSNDGLLIQHLDNLSYDLLTGVIAQPDGKILLTGTKFGNEVPRLIKSAVVRLNDNGTLDLTFGGSGIILTDIGTENGCFAAALQPDGKIVLGGYTKTSFKQSFLLVRYLSNGTLDTGFSTDGFITGDISNAIDALDIQADGKIIVAMNDNPTDNIAMMRFNANGTNDSNFSGNGKLVANITGSESAGSLNIYNNSLYVVGASSYDGGTGLVLAYLIDYTNQRPIAGAWFQKYYNPTSALLAAWGSRDPEGGPITYSWEKTAGPRSSGLLYSNSASPVVTGLAEGTYSFRLTVTDNHGDTGTAIVSFTVPGNFPPIAGAWLQKYYSPTSVLLAAWDSHDPEGGPITYFWEKTAGPEGSSLLYRNSASPVVNGLVIGTYTYRLTVTDNQGATGSKELTFTVSGVPLSGNIAAQSLPEVSTNKSGQFIIYPNPVSDQLKFYWNSDYTGDALLSVIDMSGRKVQALQIRKSGAGYYGNMEVTQLKPGQYYLYLTKGNEKIMSMSFMKQ